MANVVEYTFSSVTVSTTDSVENRLQYTVVDRVVDGQESEKLLLHWGVIQGGLLAAVLFIIYKFYK